MITLVFLDESDRTVMAGLAALNSGLARLNIPLIFAPLVLVLLLIGVIYVGNQRLVPALVQSVKR